MPGRSILAQCSSPAPNPANGKPARLTPVIRMARRRDIRSGKIRTLDRAISDEAFRKRFRSPSAVEDQFSDANRVDPHGYMTPVLPLDPSSVWWKSPSAPGPLQENPVAISKRDGHRNRDLMS